MDLMSANKFDVNSAVFNISIACITLYLVNYLFHVIKKLCKLPPGPWGLPIVGYLPFIEQDTYLQFAKLSRKYGSLFSFKYGQFDVICIDDWESTRETLASEELLARPDQVFIPGVFEDPSLFEMSGDPWKDHRRLALTILRNVGLGRKKMENQIKDEIKTFVSEIRSYNGKPFNVVNLLSLSVSNNISILLFGHRFEYTDPIGVKIEKALDELNKTGHFFNAATAIPWLVKFLLLFNHLKLEKMRQIINTIEGHVSIEVCQHQQAQKEKCEVHDYIDGYLQEMDSRQAQGKSSFTLNTLRRNTSIFYTAGADTVQLVLQWCLLYLVAYPDYQDRLRDEIFNKIGSNELPDSVDRQQMSFAMAFIYEVLRVSSVVPVDPFRRATKDIILLNGTLIPKDSLVTFNFWSIHHDPKLWTNPDSFYPERFLSEDGSKAVKPPYLIAFSGGKRVCPGESFAILQLFLYLASIVQKFKITAELDEKISLDSFYVFTRRPKSSINLVFSETH